MVPLLLHWVQSVITYPISQFHQRNWAGLETGDHQFVSAAAGTDQVMIWDLSQGCVTQFDYDLQPLKYVRNISKVKRRQWNILTWQRPSTVHRWWSTPRLSQQWHREDTVGAPARLSHRVTDAVWVELFQRSHGDCIPDLHTVSCWHQAGGLLHGDSCRYRQSGIKAEN